MAIYSDDACTTPFGTITTTPVNSCDDITATYYGAYTSFFVNATSASDDSTVNLSTGQLAGIIVGCILGALLISVGLYFKRQCDLKVQFNESKGSGGAGVTSVNPIQSHQSGL